MSEPKTVRAQMFWRMNGLPRWEQVAFAAVNIPFGLATMILGFLLWIPFRIMIFLVLRRYVVAADFGKTRQAALFTRRFFYMMI